MSSQLIKNRWAMRRSDWHTKFCLKNANGALKSVQASAFPSATVAGNCESRSAEDESEHDSVSWQVFDKSRTAMQPKYFSSRTACVYWWGGPARHNRAEAANLASAGLLIWCRSHCRIKICWATKHVWLPKHESHARLRSLHQNQFGGPILEPILGSLWKKQKRRSPN